MFNQQPPQMTNHWLIDECEHAELYLTPHPVLFFFILLSTTTDMQ